MHERGRESQAHPQTPTETERERERERADAQEFIAWTILASKQKLTQKSTIILQSPIQDQTYPLPASDHSLHLKNYC